MSFHSILHNYWIRLLPAFLLAGVLVSFQSCSDQGPEDGIETFDRAAFLSYLSDQVIVPAADTFYSSCEILKSKVDALAANQDANALLEARAAWKQAALDFQLMQVFNFGPGEKSITGTIGENLGTWPVNVNTLESRITAADYGMTDFRRDTRGFAALDYLLFGPEALNKLTGPNGTNRRDYLVAVTRDIASWASDFRQGWPAYRDQFTGNTDKGAGSPTSEYYNEFIKAFEAAKNFKLGLPLGKRAGQTQTEPALVEAYYSGHSVALLKRHLKVIEDLWYGHRADGSDGIGFDDYLKKVSGGPELHDLTIAQLDVVRQKLNSLNEQVALSEQIANNPADLDELFNEVSKLTRYLKADLSSLLGIAITYSSGDGD